MKIECYNCGKIFNKCPAKIKISKYNHCSVECCLETSRKKIYPDRTGRATDVIFDGDLMKCMKCGEFKLPEEFHSDKTREYRNGKSCYCITCEKEKRSGYSFSRENLKIRHNGDYKYFIKSLLRLSRGTDRRSRAELDLDKCINIYEKQNGLCAISGVKMTFIYGEGVVDTNISLDRIDSNLGYSHDNIQFVCRIVNMMKSKYEMDYFVNWCDLISKNNKHEQNICTAS